MNKKMTNNPAGLMLAATVTALLFSATPAIAAGDAEAGRVKAYTCTGCHGIHDYSNVYPTYKVPKIGGQNEAYLVTALKAYKSGERHHPTMNAQAESLGEQDIADIAAYFAAFHRESHASGGD